MYAQGRFDYEPSTQLIAIPGVQTTPAWQNATESMPETSGIYLTLDSQNRSWHKYFEASFGHWCMSWAEMQANATRESPCLGSKELPAYLVAWAPKVRS